ncbi:hypothetical protein M427DRAFT_66805 [Gonapodya prolifera JEL478]|uniref:Nucleoside diphosphate kinase n=1 Tax=Gonapodya prolifera (strain JEL478) TaxID=1344416 RepID=A0A139AUB7_GONPJ|nr:hypothetical protein M427DRAFT_66805 [Gonapodya prolifera JEL478]|eukprot:KXS20299.1 hypothetical protein M427DRAFT_66805 [Gonapodya prolifera JEL478]
MSSSSGAVDNRWQRAAMARWEKARLAKERDGSGQPAGAGEGEAAGASKGAAASKPVSVSAPRARIPRTSDTSATRKRKLSGGGEEDDPAGAKFDEDAERYGLDGNDFKAYKRMCGSVFLRANMLMDAERKRVKDFLVGKYDESSTGVQDIILNEETTDDGAWRDVLVFEMNFDQGKWRKLRRRYPAQAQVSANNDTTATASASASASAGAGADAAPQEPAPAAPEKEEKAVLLEPSLAAGLIPNRIKRGAFATCPARISHPLARSDAHKSPNSDYHLFFWPSDNSVEMYDVKLHRTFLKRTKYQALKLEDVHVGGSVQVYSRALAIKDYGDEFTRRKLAVKKERTTMIVVPQALPQIGVILDSILQQRFILTRMRLVVPSRQSLGAALPPDGSTPTTLVRSIVDRTVLVAEWEREGAVAELEKFVGSKWPGECYATPSTVAADRMGQVFFAPESSSGLKRTARVDKTTLCVVKPHAFHKGVTGKIIDLILKAGFIVTDAELVSLERVNAEEFLEVYKGVIPEYQSLVDEMTSGPCVALELAHHPGAKHAEPDVVKSFRDFVGPWDPEIARKIRSQSPRALFGASKVQNAVHCTDLSEDGALETEYFFKLLC